MCVCVCVGGGGSRKEAPDGPITILENVLTNLLIEGEEYSVVEREVLPPCQKADHIVGESK